MQLITKNIIRRIFQDIATAHYQINTFGYGELWELPQLYFNEDNQTLNDRLTYSILFVSPDPDPLQGKTLFYGYKIVVADLVKTGEQNEGEVESDTLLILLDVIAQIQDQNYGFLLDTDNIGIEPFTERFADNLTGHIATVRLKTGFEYNRCQIPSSFISISTPYIPLNEEGTNEMDPLSWHKQGNSLATSSVIGSTNDQDWRIIHNNVTIATVQASGLNIPNIVGDVALDGNLVITGSIDYASGAIQSLNGLTGKTQVFAIGSSGTDLNIVSSGNTHTISIPDAGVGITGGLVSDAAQTFGGVKTFQSQIIRTANGVGENVVLRVDLTQPSAAALSAVNDVYNNTAVTPVFFGRTGFVMQSGSGTNNKQYQIYVVDPNTPWVNINGSGNAAFGQGVITAAARVQIRGAVNNAALLVDTSAGLNILTIRETAGVRQIGFLGNAAIARPTITGSKGGNAALANLLTQLANYGLITDSTT